MGKTWNSSNIFFSVLEKKISQVLNMREFSFLGIVSLYDVKWEVSENVDNDEWEIFRSIFFFLEKEAREIMLFSLSHRVFVFLQPNSLLKPLPHSCLSLKYTNREERQIDQIISEI